VTQTKNSLIKLHVSLNFQTERALSLASDLSQFDKNEAAWAAKLSDGLKILNFKEGSELSNLSFAVSLCDYSVYGRVCVLARIPSVCNTVAHNI
jgi:hypothetical protein